VTDTLIRLPATPGHRFWAETATSPPDWWFVVQVDHFLGPNYVSARGGSLTWRSAVTEALRELPAPVAPKVPPPAGPVIRVTAVHRAVEPQTGADGSADTGMRLRPRYPSATLAQAVGVLTDAGFAVHEGWPAAANHPSLAEAFGEVWSGPEARALAHQILDDCPGQCDADRDCRMGAEHDGPHLWRQGGWRD
jgi:hypothetical protein